jgi:hypothetical protein
MLRSSISGLLFEKYLAKARSSPLVSTFQEPYQATLPQTASAGVLNDKPADIHLAFILAGLF